MSRNSLFYNKLRLFWLRAFFVGYRLGYRFKHFDDNVDTMSHYYKIPSSLQGNELGFSFLADFAMSVKECYLDNITLDFKDCIFIQGNLCAVIGAIINDLHLGSNNVEIVNVGSNIHGLLSRNSFLHHFNSENYYEDDRNTCIPYSVFGQEDEKKATDFFFNQLFTKPRMPQMSISAKKQVITNIFEICINAVTHSGCNIVHCCGQVFPKQKRAIVSFVDMGKTIKQNVNEYLNKELEGYDSIVWAIGEGNTTREGNTPGGLGLNEVYQLIKMNQGNLKIISADGFVEISNGEKIKHYIGNNFPGTIVNMEIKLEDTNFYILDSEQNDDDVVF